MTPPPDDTPPIAPIALEEETIDLSDQQWDDSVVLVLFWLLAGVVFLQFFTRYVLNDSIAWTEEIARFLLIGVTFLGAIMATRKQSHIAVEFIYRWVPRTGRRIAQFVIDAVTTGFFIILAVLSGQIAGRTRQLMVSIELPKSTVYWIVAAAFVCMALYSAWNMWVHLRDGTSKLIDPEKYADQIRAID
ncbi:TRAP transporter small permease [Sulfitobacter sp. CW3]|jgi:TRAP-type C4-dicarboxylate transport system permease small subunit|uniref:TRAP transporter small permease n=1 Tax=unclassified Sulfitobacter TaxID=196795 RepID=UPI0019DD48F7|nr:TRAP transporter small permease [Sulfitobacter sp. CW3]MBW4963419.1 TRAP transporter small permease [Sulfitobacter sp. CW3]NOR30938.1 TRAP transporter small permease subunit [Sulfitobacter sp.]